MADDMGFFRTDELYSEKFIVDKIDKMAKGRDNRAAIIQLFGGKDNIPSSVMRAKRATKIDPEVDGPTARRGYVKTSKRYVNGEYKKYPKDMVKSAIISGGYGCGAGALSTFPQNVGRSILLLYSKPGDIVFDPFAGHNSRMDLCVKEHRNYVGCDLSHDFMEFNRKRARELRKKHPSLRIEVHECDSRKVPIKENGWADFTITCYDDETEVLTDSGWKLFAAVRYEDKIATLNRQTGATEYQHPEDITASSYAGRMRHISTPFVNLMVTPNHNLFIKRKHKKEFELIRADKAPDKGNYELMIGGGKWKGEEQEFFLLSGLKKFEGKCRAFHPCRTKKYTDALVPMDAFLEFMGYWLAEGSLGAECGPEGSRSYSFVLSQKSEDNVKKFVDVINRLGITTPPRVYKVVDKETGNYIHRVVGSDRRMHNYLKQFGHAEDKFIPRELLSLSQRQLKILFDAMMLGDGGNRGDRYWTVSTRLRDDFMELCFKLGYGSGHNHPIVGEYQNFPCWRIGIKKEKTTVRVEPAAWKANTECAHEWVHYQGMVYCVSVPNRVIYVRRKGKASWCGNSPPYWDVEDYGDEIGQLGKLEGGYKGFLEGMVAVMKENYRMLKPGTFATYFINDFRKKGRMHFYHMDLIRCGKKAGFEAHDICIVDLGHGIRDCFIAQIVETRILPKRHEYCVVFRKPLESQPKKKGKKG